MRRPGASYKAFREGFDRARRIHRAEDTMKRAEAQLAEIREEHPGPAVYRQHIDFVSAARRSAAVRPLRLEPEVPAANDSALVIAHDGSFFRPPASEVVDLRRYEKLRLVLGRLRRERLDNPGEGVALTTLLAAGWPGERVLPKAGASRVYVALSTLRRLGLRRILLSRRGAYLLDPTVRVELADPLASEPIPGLETAIG
jgi:hypothetical protein